MKYPVCPYQLNMDNKNRLNNGEVLVAEEELSELTNQEEAVFLADVLSYEVDSVYEVGFNHGNRLLTLMNLGKFKEVTGCEFNPLFTSYGKNLFDYPKSFDNFKIFTTINAFHETENRSDVVFVSNWILNLDSKDQLKIVKTMVKVAKQNVVVPKGISGEILDIYKHEVNDNSISINAMLVHFDETGKTIMPSKDEVQILHDPNTQGKYGLSEIEPADTGPAILDNRKSFVKKMNDDAWDVLVNKAKKEEE